MTGMRRAGMPAAAAALALSLLAPVPAGGQAPPPAPGTSLTLSSQTPWVGTEGTFSLRVHVERPSGAGNLDIAVTVYPAVATRSEFAVTVRDQATAPPLGPPSVFPLSTLTPDAAGEVTIPVELSDRLPLGHDDGVFPVRVDLRERASGRVLSRFTTHLVHLPAAHPGARLGLSVVLPFHAPPGLPAEGARKVQGLDALASLPPALDALRGTPVAVAPTPETLATLAASSDQRAADLLGALRLRLPATTVIAGPYVPTTFPAVSAAGVPQDVTTSVERGSAAIADVLRLRPDASTWLARDPLDSDALGRLAARGVDRVVAAEDDLSPVPNQKLTLAQPFRLQYADSSMPGAAADSGLAAYFDNTKDPVLAANHLLADLAVVYLDQPGADRRALVAVAPRQWRPDRRFLEALAGGLASNPILEPVPLDAVFSSVAPARAENGRPLVRTLVPPKGPGLSDVASDLRVARRRLDALGSVLGAGAPARGLLEERLLLAESNEWHTSRQRQAYVQAVLRGISAELGDIRTPDGGSITLTARKGEIPVTFQNGTGVPATVMVRVESDKLVFPRGSSHLLDLPRQNTTDRFAVVLRTSGAFPLRITLVSPDGSTVIDETRLTIRSAAASGVSLVVSLGAALFLAVWWGRHALRGRRARRLVPA